MVVMLVLAERLGHYIGWVFGTLDFHDVVVRLL